MRILHVITAFQLGGAEELAINLTRGMVHRGHQCCVVTVGRIRGENEIGKNQRRRLSEVGIDIVELAGFNMRWNALFAPFRLSALIKSWKPDIVHSHTDIPDFIVSLTRRVRKFRVARTIHNSELWSTHPIFGRLCEAAFQDDLIVFISKDTKTAYQALRRRYALPESGTQHLIPNGVFVPDKAERFGRSHLAEACDADLNKAQFCFAGRYNPQKGFDILLKAIAKLSPDYLRRCEFHAFGRGEDREKYVEAVSRDKLPVLFHPPVSQIVRLLSAFDAVVMPSRFEGLPLLAIESMAVGTPVIVTRAPGLREAIPPDWPLVSPVEDPEAMRDLLVTFLDGAFDTAQLAEQGMNWVQKHNSLDGMVDEYERAYREFSPARDDPPSRKIH